MTDWQIKLFRLLNTKIVTAEVLESFFALFQPLIENELHRQAKSSRRHIDFVYKPSDFRSVSATLFCEIQKLDIVVSDRAMRVMMNILTNECRKYNKAICLNGISKERFEKPIITYLEFDVEDQKDDLTDYILSEREDINLDKKSKEFVLSQNLDKDLTNFLVDCFTRKITLKSFFDTSEGEKYKSYSYKLKYYRKRLANLLLDYLIKKYPYSEVDLNDIELFLGKTRI